MDSVSKSSKTGKKILKRSLPMIPESRLAAAAVGEAVMADEHVPLRGYVSRIFTQVSLPYRDPAPTGTEVNAFIRRNGDLTLTVIPDMRPADGAEGKLLAAFPYGKYPRLILPWLTTQIVLNSGARRSDGSLEIDLPESLRGMLNELGFRFSSSEAREGGRTHILMREQVQRLFAASFRVTQRSEDATGEGFRQAQFSIARSVQLWWGKDHDDIQDGLWGNSVVVGAEFVEDTLSVPIPIDLTAIAALSRFGPLAMDIYTWMNYRLPLARRTSLVTWELLRRQFGAQYARERDFKAAFIKKLAAAKTMYPHARITVCDEGVLVAPSDPAVPRRKLTE